MKAAFTRAYNKSVPLLPFSTNTGVSKKRNARVDNEYGDEDVEEDLEEDNDDVQADAMIKVLFFFSDYKLGL